MNTLSYPGGSIRIKEGSKPSLSDIIGGHNIQSNMSKKESILEALRLFQQSEASTADSYEPIVKSILRLKGRGDTSVILSALITMCGLDWVKENYTLIEECLETYQFPSADAHHDFSSVMTVITKIIEQLTKEQTGGNRKTLEVQSGSSSKTMSLPNEITSNIKEKTLVIESIDWYALLSYLLFFVNEEGAEALKQNDNTLVLVGASSTIRSVVALGPQTEEALNKLLEEATIKGDYRLIETPTGTKGKIDPSIPLVFANPIDAAGSKPSILKALCKDVQSHISS